MWKKIRNFVYDSCDIMELVMAMMVLVAIFVAFVSLWNPFMDFVNSRFEHGSFLTFVGYVFNILIGIEFLKLLCHPNANTVLEVLTFLVARHMIIEETSVVENLLSIVSIAVLFAMKKYLDLPTNAEGADMFVSDYDWKKFQEKRKQKRDKVIQEKSERLKQRTKPLQMEDNE